VNKRLEDIPVYEKKIKPIEANIFNAIRVRQLRLKKSLRFELKDLRTLDLILENDAWIVVDRSLNDIPVMAWIDFSHRDNLHLPVECTILYYHAHAEKIEQKILEYAAVRVKEILGG
jgi:hypothetical protein